MKLTHLLPVALLLFGGAAFAQPAISIQGTLGAAGEAEVDKIKAKGGQSADGDDEDLESQFGVMATFDVPVSGKLRLGGRAAYSMAEGDDTEEDYTFLDGGLWARFPFVDNGKMSVFAAGGAGVSYIQVKLDAFDDPSGIGWHIMLGGGATYEISPGIALIGGLYWLRHAATLEGEYQGTDVELEDAVASRFQLAAGIQF